MTMPEQIRKLLMDPTIVKVGSGMLCFMSGHDRSVQTDPESTQRELRQRFLMSQPEGQLTCLPLLCSSEQVRVKMQVADWCFGLRGMPFRIDSVS